MLIPGWKPYLSDVEIEKLQRGREKYLAKGENPYGDPDEPLYHERIVACEELPARLKELRLLYGWSALKVSDFAECSEMHIRHLEHGRRKPGYQIFCRLADAFGIDRDALLDEELYQKAISDLRIQLSENSSESC